MPTVQDVNRAVEGRAAVAPSLLWFELGGEGDGAPLWVFAQLRRLGYGPIPAAFWWRSDIPIELAQRLIDFECKLDALYPSED